MAPQSILVTGANGLLGRAVTERLKAEGYGVEQLSGPALLRQLRDLCAASQKR